MYLRRNIYSRCISCAHSGSDFATPDTNSYRYNVCSELTSATAAVDSDYSYGYNFDDIGNRKTSAERGTNSVYTASQLNQYTAVDDFTPTYDADGNETVVKTATGIWNVTYNGENRPVRWTQGDTVITMSFDRMGRRVTKNDQRFVYNGYLQIANFRSTATTSDYNYCLWDPTEPVATRPLVWTKNDISSYYAFDGNKNVSEVLAADGSVSAHYEYAPFGALTVSHGTSATANPFRFSSEYAEDDTATVYYNYRHYEPATGRWLRRDPVGNVSSRNLYAFMFNIDYRTDCLGLMENDKNGNSDVLKVIEHLESRAEADILSFSYKCDDLVVDEENKEEGSCKCKRKDGTLGDYYRIKGHKDCRNTSRNGSVRMVDWEAPKGVSNKAIELYRKVYEIILAHENEHVRIHDLYASKFTSIPFVI